MMKNKINDLKEVIRQFSIISQDLLAENQSLQKRLEQKENEVSELNIRNEKEIASLEKQIESLKSDKNALEAQRDKLDSDVSRKKKKIMDENENLKDRIEDLKKQLKESESYKGKVKFLEKQLDESNRNIREMLENILTKLACNADSKSDSYDEKEIFDGIRENLEELKQMVKCLKYEYGEDDEEKACDKKDVCDDDNVNDSGESSQENADSNKDDTLKNTQENGITMYDNPKKM